MRRPVHQRRPIPLPQNHGPEVPGIAPGQVVWLLAVIVAAAAVAHANPPTRQPDQKCRTLLDLSKKETFLPIAVNADPQRVSITRVEVEELPSEHQLIPASGIGRFGQPLDIQLQEPNNVRIRMAIVKRGKELAVRISPQIVISENNAIDLTRDRVMRAARNLQRQVKQLNSQLTALTNERKAINVWLITPGNKPLDSVRLAYMRLKILADLIKTRQREVPAAQQQCQALSQAAEFVSKLHKKVEIRFEVETLSDPKETAKSVLAASTSYY